MGITDYGLWKGTPTSWDGTAASDHGHLTFTDGTNTGTSYEADVNIMSKGKEKRLVYWLVSSYDAQKPSTSALQALPQGFSKQSGSDSLALDFLRGGFLDVDAGVLLSHDPSDPDEKGDILSYLDPILSGAVAAGATVYLWGSRWADPDGSAGIHDIHMNQGSAGSFARENGTYQDGGIVVESPDGGWQGVFLAFASEATKTDAKGDADGPTFAEVLGGAGGAGKGGKGGSSSSSSTTAAATRPAHAHSGVSIEAAIVSPAGSDDGADHAHGHGETVYLLNRSSSAQSLEGWTVGNDRGESQALSGEVSAHAKKAIKVSAFGLSSRGGKIVLKDERGETVSEVDYTEKQARIGGRLLYFAN